jgi:hypothetical protein
LKGSGRLSTAGLGDYLQFAVLGVVGAEASYPQGLIGEVGIGGGGV